MAVISDTAYPRLQTTLSGSSLNFFTPTEKELSFVKENFAKTPAILSCLLMLKCFQRLGYFPLLTEVPHSIIRKISEEIGSSRLDDSELERHNSSTTRKRQRIACLKFLNIKPFSAESISLIEKFMKREIQVKDDLVDLINVAIEELIKNRYELPGFSTLLETAQSVRARWNEEFFSKVNKTLSPEQKSWIDKHLEAGHKESLSFWQEIKTDPGSPTLTQLRELLSRYKRLNALGVGTHLLKETSKIKIERFSSEAKTLDISKMRRLQAEKRYALAICLYHTTRSRALDDLCEMLIKRVRKINQKAEDELEEFRRQNQKRVDRLISRLGDVAKIASLGSKRAKTLQKIKSALGDPEKVVRECEDFAAFSENNHHPFFWKFLRSHRKILFEILREVEFTSTSHDQKLIQALRFLMNHSHSNEEWIPVYIREEKSVKLLLDLSFIPSKWWRCVTGLASKKEVALKVDRKHFEACLFTLLSEELQSGDIAVVGGSRYSDYREELLSDEEYRKKLLPYAKAVGLPVDRPKSFVQELREKLKEKILKVDREFLENTSIRIKKGEPILSKAPRKSEKKRLSEIESQIRSRLDQVTILDILLDTEEWLNWSKAFKPISGQNTRIREPGSRYIATIFCYGCGLGPAQTSRSLKTRIDKNQIHWIHHHHIQEQTLEKVITSVINAYQQFELPKHWGTGKHVAADGTKWEVGSKNLLSEYHIRYGGYGGIGYYHVSDTYIALFSRFIPCGVWEAVYLLDGLIANESEIKPSRVHGDTQAQNTPVFALSFLLGIELMPRIRNWKELKLFKPSRSLSLKHTGSFFSDEVINWNLIEDHLPDMIRLVLSIQTGKLTASTVLRKLGTRSRKNRLYFAFRELGRAIRTIYLLDFISDPNLRATIQSCTNKAEAFHDFAQWVDFGGAGLRFENSRDEQRKLIKYNHLVANLIILHNVQAVTQVINTLFNEGIIVDSKTLSLMSPYLTAHINRFGDYRIDPDRKPSPICHELNVQLKEEMTHHLIH